MPETPAIHFHNVSKTYKLYGSQKDQFLDVLGLSAFGLKPRLQPKLFNALTNIDLAVPKGKRIGIIGRNGAGKTTLLKLICGNFAPTSGKVFVDGSVQALLNVGLGFHPDYTGKENISSAMQYTSLGANQYAEAIEGIVDFCELGDFLDQPFKSYSLGMQARLMFAVATAIKPDILIVDEVLGAGDAYFLAKSKRRVEKMIASGCTMLLVSHSMQQILELCDEAVWLDQGTIRMHDHSFLVVKAYEEYMETASAAKNSIVGVPTGNHPVKRSAPSSVFQEEAFVTLERKEITDSHIIPQDPPFFPHLKSSYISSTVVPGFSCLAPGGISRWPSNAGLKITGFSVNTENGPSASIKWLQVVKLIFTLTAEQSGSYSCRYGVAFNDASGVCVSRIFSQCDTFDITENCSRQIEVLLNPCQFGPGDYTVGISVSQYKPLELINAAERYDILSRSFRLKVLLPDSLAPMMASFFHTAEWSYLPTD